MDDNLFDENENENNTNTISKVNSIPSIVIQLELENAVNVTSTSNTDNVISASNAVNVTSTSNAELKPKGILKNTTRNSCDNLLKQIWNRHKQSERRASCLEMCHKRNNQEDSNDAKAVIDNNAGLLPTANTPKSVKSVTFSDMTHDAKLKPSSSMPIITKYLYDQKRNSQNLHLMNTKQVDSYKKTSINKVPICTTNSCQFEDFDTDESSDDEINFGDLANY